MLSWKRFLNCVINYRNNPTFFIFLYLCPSEVTPQILLEKVESVFQSLDSGLWFVLAKKMKQRCIVPVCSWCPWGPENFWSLYCDLEKLPGIGCHLNGSGSQPFQADERDQSTLLELSRKMTADACMGPAGTRRINYLAKWNPSSQPPKL